MGLRRVCEYFQRASALRICIQLEESMKVITCTPKELTRQQLEFAISRAMELNPANAAGSRIVGRTPTGRRGGRLRLTLDIKYRWPVTGAKLTVRFWTGRERT